MISWCRNLDDEWLGWLHEPCQQMGMVERLTGWRARGSRASVVGLHDAEGIFYMREQAREVRPFHLAPAEGTDEVTMRRPRSKQELWSERRHSLSSFQAAIADLLV
jgi:hypothetical protein